MNQIIEWTVWCWAAFWMIWFLAWFFTKPTQWQQGLSSRAQYGFLLWFGFPLIFYSFGHPVLMVLPRVSGVAWLGFLLTLIGLLFAVWARFTLGMNWSRSMDLKQGHELITSGPYGIVRHPIYAALILMSLGSAIVTGSALAFLGLCLIAWSCWIRIKREEALMGQTFSDTYPIYTQRVKRLVPFIF